MKFVDNAVKDIYEKLFDVCMSVTNVNKCSFLYNGFMLKYLCYKDLQN